MVVLRLPRTAPPGRRPRGGGLCPSDGIHNAPTQRAIDLARAELQRLLSVPESDVGVRQRARLEARIAKLAKLYSWGDLSEGDSRREVADTRGQLAAIPDESKVITFDRHSRVIEDMVTNVERFTPGQLQELARLPIERVEARDGQVESVVWSGPARPRDWRPRTDSNRRRRP